MPGDIIVTTGEQANRWSRQFCRQPSWTAAEASRAGLSVRRGSRNLVEVHGSSRQDIVSAISRAAGMAHGGGRVIYNIGHGFGGRNGANVMFSPNPTFTVGSEILAGDRTVVSGPATVTIRLSQDQADIRTRFLQIGEVLSRNRVSQFIFLVCGVGANAAFMRQIKAAWGGSVAISGYNDGVTLEDDVVRGDQTYPRTRLYLFRDGGDTSNPNNRRRLGTNTSATPLSWLEMPAGEITV